MEAGWDEAVALVQNRDSRSHAHDKLAHQGSGRPVYGTQGRVRLHPGEMSGHG